MSAQLDEDDIAKRVKAYRSRLYAPWPYALILLIPLVASLAKAPVSSAVLWTGTLSLYAVATFVRAFILGRRPNPLADIEPAVYRPWLRELNGAGRRMQIVLFSAMLGLWLWAGASSRRAASRDGARDGDRLRPVRGPDHRHLPCSTSGSFAPQVSGERGPRAGRGPQEPGGAPGRRQRYWRLPSWATRPRDDLWPNFGPAVLAGVIWTACAGPC